MSGILSGLRSFHVGSDEVVALDDVREALTNPTDEQMVAMCRAAAHAEGDDPSMTDEQVVFVYALIVAAVLAAAVGGDR